MVLYILWGFNKHIMTCIQHCSIIQNSFIALKIFCALLVSPLTPPLETPGLFTVTIVLPCLECCVVGIRQYVAFPIGLFHIAVICIQIFSVSFHGFISHFSVWIRFHCLNVLQFIHSPTKVLPLFYRWWDWSWDQLICLNPHICNICHV